MTTSTTEAIKNKLDIVELLKGYISLQPAGKNFKARCPFHQEKTPSFMVSPERQSWHCFGCGIGGDIFSFVMRYENLEFAEAMKILAEKAGLELQRLSPQEYKFFGLLYDLNSAAKDFYIKELESSPVALNYLKERGLKEETIKEFEVGFAPSTGDALNLYFINHGYNSDDVLRAASCFRSITTWGKLSVSPVASCLNLMTGKWASTLIVRRPPSLTSLKFSTAFTKVRTISENQNPFFSLKAKPIY